MKNIILKILIFSSCVATSQTWQWAKRGGASESCNNGDRQEEVSSMVTDSNKNVYIVSFVTRTDLNVDGNPKTNWGDNTTLRDVMIASFACDGSYRWSKVIGGSNSFEEVHNLQIDAQNNIYFAGRLAGDGQFNAKIDNDYTVVETYFSRNYSKIFIAKYNSVGVMQWVRRPQADDVPGEIGQSSTSSVGILTDSQGTSTWFVKLPAGSYANGQFTVTTAGVYILRYNSAGAFVSGQPFALAYEWSFPADLLRIYRNPITNNIYLLGTTSLDELPSTVTLGGQPVINSNFLACFNAAGTLLWKRESNQTSFGWCYPYGLAFDQDNNIYIGGTFLQNAAISNSYLGYFLPVNSFRQFIMKLNPDASQVLWGSNSNAGGVETGGIAFNAVTNQVALTSICYGTYTWGGQSLQTNVLSNQGLDVLLARFNKNTGACVALSQIPSSIYSSDNGTALAVDISGDYIVGGAMGGTIYPNATTTLTSVGGRSDFFVAKFATQPCSSLDNASFEKASMQVYPNPTTGLVTVAVTETTNFELLDVLGKVLKKGSISVADNVIDLIALSKGVYFLKTKSAVVKVLKE